MCSSKKLGKYISVGIVTIYRLLPEQGHFGGQSDLRWGQSHLTPPLDQALRLYYSSVDCLIRKWVWSHSSEAISINKAWIGRVCPSRSWTFLCSEFKEFISVMKFSESSVRNTVFSSPESRAQFSLSLRSHQLILSLRPITALLTRLEPINCELSKF